MSAAAWTSRTAGPDMRLPAVFRRIGPRQRTRIEPPASQGPAISGHGAAKLIPGETGARVRQARQTPSGLGPKGPQTDISPMILNGSRWCISSNIADYDQFARQATS